MWRTKSHLTGLMVLVVLMLAACTSTIDSPTAAPESSGPATSEAAEPTGVTGSVGTPSPDAASPPDSAGESQDTGHGTGDSPNQADQGQISPWSLISDRKCGDGPLFSAYPMDLGKVININPLGNLGPPGHTFPTSHIYFGVEAVWGEAGEGPFGDGQTFPPNPVNAIAAGQLISINVSKVTTSLSGQEVSYEEYGFDIAVCEGLRVRYGHVGPVSDRILASIADLEGFNCNAYSTGAFAVDSCTYALLLELEVGEQVGFNSGRSAALDIGAFDITTETIEFLHPTLYGEEATGSVCVLDLYPEDQRLEMLNLLGDNNGFRTAEPICGVLDYIVVVTLQGDWFNEIGDFPQQDLNIAFVYDEVLPDVPVISIGFVPGFRRRFRPARPVCASVGRGPGGRPTACTRRRRRGVRNRAVADRHGSDGIRALGSVSC